MAYEILINSTIVGSSAKPANKPNYTPAKSFKRALKVVRKFFKKSQRKHQIFLNESLQQAADFTSDEECENMANERREAATSNN